MTENQNRLLYLISLYSQPAVRKNDKEEWIRKPALLVLLYECIVTQALDYDYAPASEIIEGRRKYFNISQEGKSDIDFLREEELLNGLKMSSKSYQPVSCYQISEKGLDLVSKIGKSDKAPINETVGGKVSSVGDRIDSSRFMLPEREISYELNGTAKSIGWVIQRPTLDEYQLSLIRKMSRMSRVRTFLSVYGMEDDRH